MSYLGQSDARSPRGHRKSILSVEVDFFLGGVHEAHDGPCALRGLSREQALVCSQPVCTNGDRVRHPGHMLGNQKSHWQRNPETFSLLWGHPQNNDKKSIMVNKKGPVDSIPSNNKASPG